MALPAFLDATATDAKQFGYYAEDAGGIKIARAGLDIDTFERQVANLLIMGYHVTALSPTQQIALLSEDLRRAQLIVQEVST